MVNLISQLPPPARNQINMQLSKISRMSEHQQELFYKQQLRVLLEQQAALKRRQQPQQQVTASNPQHSTPQPSNAQQGLMTPTAHTFATKTPACQQSSTARAGQVS